jgi:hypothetical protein
MNQFTGRRNEFKALLRELVGASEAWGTDRGAHVFAQLNARLPALAEGTLVLIDYSGVERADVSFQREAVVETLRRHRPRLLFVAANLVNPDVRANLESALERRRESLILRLPLGEHEVIGRRLTNEYATTLRAVRGKNEFTSAMLTGKPFGLESSTASARLTALWKAGLIERIQGSASSGGREYKYFSID